VMRILLNRVKMTYHEACIFSFISFFAALAYFFLMLCSCSVGSNENFAFPENIDCDVIHHFERPPMLHEYFALDDEGRHSAAVRIVVLAVGRRGDEDKTIFESI
jgi:hypothetical protein